MIPGLKFGQDYYDDLLAKYTQALPFAASASAAQSSAASGYQDSSYSLFSPKSYQENKKDTWRSSVFSPAVFDNASPCGIITVL